MNIIKTTLLSIAILAGCDSKMTNEIEKEANKLPVQNNTLETPSEASNRESRMPKQAAINAITPVVLPSGTQKSTKLVKKKLSAERKEGDLLGIYKLSTSSNGFSGTVQTTIVPIFVGQTEEEQQLAIKINKRFFQEFFDDIPDFVKNEDQEPSHFINWNIPEGYSELDYKIEQNNRDKVIVSLNYEYCGSYCKQGQTSMTFSGETGEYFDIDNILSKEGYEYLSEQHKNFKKLKTKSKIAQIKKQLSAIQMDKNIGEAEKQESTNRLEEQLMVYTDCDEEVYIDAKLVQYKQDSLIVKSGQCAPHVYEALDDLGDFVKSYSYQELQGFFSPHGTELLKLN